MRGIAILLFLAVAAPQARTTPQTFEGLSAQARQAYKADHLQEAAQLFTRAVKLRPDWTEGWWALGMIAYERDQYPACRDALTRMVHLDGSAAPGWALLGLCEFQTKQYDPAFQHLKKAHMLVSVTEAGGPLLNMANYRLAELLTRKGAFEVALEVYLDVALKVRDNPRMIFAAGLAALRMPILPADVPSNQRDVVMMAGKAFWDIAAEAPPETEAAFRALVSKYPKFPNVHYFYGTYLAAHHPDQCASQFLQELRVNPGSVPARVQLCLRYLVEKKTAEALKMAREAVALSPESVGTQLALGEVYQAQGNNKLALVAFLEAKRIDPDDPHVLTYLVNIYRVLGQVENMKRELAAYKRLKAAQSNWP
ncbi:MAG: tetratricopeptide repeat protein [Acidobacteriota bacterium]